MSAKRSSRVPPGLAGFAFQSYRSLPRLAPRHSTPPRFLPAKNADVTPRLASCSWISIQLGAPGFRVAWRESAVDEAFGFVSVGAEGGTVEERSAVQVLEAGSRTQRRATSEKGKSHSLSVTASDFDQSPHGRMDQPSPLDVGELLENCIAHLSTARDLKSCSLVSRRWVYTAQSQLFRAPSRLTLRRVNIRSNITEDISWSTFLDILDDSPHLIRHIRCLTTGFLWANEPEFSRICLFPFTHLHEIDFMCHYTLSPPFIAALQQLFSLPSLRRVGLCGVFSHREDFIRLWDRCSPGITHLSLRCEDTAAPVGYRRPPIVRISLRGIPVSLQSLNLANGQATILQIGSGSKVPWQTFGTVVQSIEALSVFTNVSISQGLWLFLFLGLTSIQQNAASLDLSSFPKLAALRVVLCGIPPHPRRSNGSIVSDLFSTIGPKNVIRKIVVAVSNPLTGNANLYELLDTKLSSLPMPDTPIVEFVIGSDTYEAVRPFAALIVGRIGGREGGSARASVSITNSVRWILESNYKCGKWYELGCGWRIQQGVYGENFTHQVVQHATIEGKS
ncbi:hypothetical protein B0H14DRAFT_3590977 [Mycena olivaceomarginata]|nr:hypothetical protein B0H14DRAFT_3590977 [Mycena olivaceomarginata]